MLNLGQIKGRVAENMYHRTMSLLYGIQNCHFNYPEAQYQDDLARIDILSSGRDCRTMKVPQLPANFYAGPKDRDPEYAKFWRRERLPIIVELGTCVSLPIPNCNSCSKLA